MFKAAFTMRVKNYTLNSFLEGSLAKVMYTEVKKKNNPIKDIIEPTEEIKFQPA